MAALLTTLLSLALCSVPAVAYRDDLSLALHNHLGVEAATAALHRRAGASVNASMGDASVGAGELDSALERKEGNTRCVCLRKLATKENVKKDKDPVVFAEGVNLGEKPPCSEVCPNLCNERLSNIFGASEAKAVDMEPVSLPVRVSQCDDKESCTCLDTNTATFNVKEYFSKDWGPLEISDIVDQKEYYHSNAQCHESCSCKGGYSQLCVDQWSWSTFLATDGIGGDVVGLTSTQLVQGFELYGGVNSGGQEFTADLDWVHDTVGNVYEMKEKVLSFSAEGESTTTYNVQIGLGGGETSKTWEFKRRGASISGKDKGWSLKEKNGKETFSIKETEQGEEWKVKRITDSNKAVKFWVQRVDPNKIADAMFRFYTDLEKKIYQGSLQPKKAGGCTVEVFRGKDAGLILVTSILIAKTNDPPLC